MRVTSNHPAAAYLPEPSSDPSNKVEPLLLVGGHVIDPANGRNGVADVLMRDGRVEIVEKGLGVPAAEAKRVDVNGLIVCPGLVDIHVHLREPGQEHKETIETGSKAGVAGGFTSLCCMPNTSPALDSPELMRFVYERALAAGNARVFPVACVTRERAGREIVDFAALTAAGAVGFTDDGAAVENVAAMQAALEYSARTGWTIFQHAEDPALGGGVMNAGRVAERLGLKGWPAVAEELTIQRDLTLCRHLNWTPRYHVQHVSTRQACAAIAEARRHTPNVSGEASPHHLLLTDAEIEHRGSLAKMNPPLRTAADVHALRQAVCQGDITCLATDHAPHAADEKARPLTEAPYGIVGLETAVPLYAEALLSPAAQETVADSAVSLNPKAGLSWSQLIALMTIRSAELCRLDRPEFGHRGTLTPGGVADVTVIDPKMPWAIRAKDHVGRSANTPFDGRDVRGRAVMTIVSGAVKYAIGPFAKMH